MASLSASLYGASTNKGFGGLVSGLDTDDLVKQKTARTRNKIDRQYQSKQKLLYRQEAYREVSSKLLAFSNKYFAYSSGSTSNVLSSSFFKSNAIESSSKYVSVSGDAENIKNFAITDISNVATAANFSSNKIVSNHTISSSAITASTSSLAGETMSIEYEGKIYNLTIDKNFGQGDVAVELSKVVEQLNTQLKTITGNDNNQLLKYKLDATGKQIAFETGTAKLAAASTKIIDTLNFKTGQSAISTADVTKSLTVLKEDILKNPDAYMTFDFNGVQKTIKLNNTITTELALKTHLQTELNKAYGDGKVTVGYDEGTKKLSFTANGDNNIFGVSSISKELSCFTGIEPSTYNRVNQNKAISETNLVTPLVSGNIGDSKNGYAISVNGKEFKFEETVTLSDIMKEINSNVEAGVKIYYSSTTDTFTVKSTETGSNQGVDIKDVKGNLGSSLFGSGANNLLKDGEYLEYDKINDNYSIMFSDVNGVKTNIGKAQYNSSTNIYTVDYDDVKGTDTFGAGSYTINAGKDTEMTYSLNGVPTTVTRSTANLDRKSVV